MVHNSLCMYPKHKHPKSYFPLIVSNKKCIFNYRVLLLVT